MTVDFMGYKIFAGDIDACASEMAAEAASGRRDCRTMACLNPHSYVMARDDPDFRAALRGVDWLLPDGAGVVIAARHLDLPIPQRVTGPDTFLAVMARLDASGGSVFFLGASEETLVKIRRRMAAEYPGAVLAGTYSPPYKPNFSETDNAEMIAAVNVAQPDVLWVGMTAPKQELWLATHRGELDVGVAGAIGAAFDFFAGTVQRSPAIFRMLGLEWLPRLVQQPRRLWRRMLISAPIFLADVRRERQRKKQNPAESE